MPMPFPSALIRYGRLAKSWSQEGLCEGICAVSYLSKIEQGKASPSDDIVRLLLERLGFTWHGGEEANRARALAEALEEALISMDADEAKRLFEALDKERESLLNGPSMLDLMLLERLLRGLYDEEPPQERVPLKRFEGCFTTHQRALWLIGEERAEEAIALLPVAYVYLQAGGADYCAGRYTKAAERLLQACSLAAEEGRARVLLHGRVLLGNCYSDLRDEAAMLGHYRAAQRLARDLNETGLLESIGYNIAATDIELGHYERACAALEALSEQTALTLHKLAVCYEKLGRKEAALSALERAKTAPASFPGRAWCDRMLELVRYRLAHPEYLKDAAYGALLISAFEDMRRELPQGYAGFHLPWVEEWYVANRQYKQAYELRRAVDGSARKNEKSNFPEKEECMNFKE